MFDMLLKKAAKQYLPVFMPKIIAALKEDTDAINMADNQQLVFMISLVGADLKIRKIKLETGETNVFLREIVGEWNLLELIDKYMLEGNE